MATVGLQQGKHLLSRPSAPQKVIRGFSSEGGMDVGHTGLQELGKMRVSRIQPRSPSCKIPFFPNALNFNRKNLTLSIYYNSTNNAVKISYWIGIWCG